ncbi:hypothetical protein CW751_01290 [Brumimicrobium salinarum]|uniref:DUF4625 domain-containing protein n=1 Tax=Brumimicrobium salinarum TaxID=2058658 RepID=A0A2I0R6K6_9FLAO|nr:hypothetical protein [Brumimicrobium salinarum]PKR82000.1 hypothetical protein CW751_01290 [Brumimicrobium salinarum]
MKQKHTLFLLLLVVMSMISTSCKNTDDSILKIYVRSSDNILTPNINVRIVGDIDKDTPEYFDEKRSDDSGVAKFNLNDLFDQYDGKDDKVAYLTVYAKDTADYYTSITVRAKAHLTATETINLEE